MKIENKNLGISLIALLPATMLGIFFTDYQNNGMTKEQFVPAAYFFVFFIVILILLSLGKTVFSEDGIMKQYLWIKKRYPWDQVIQAGCIPLDTDPTAKQLAFTFQGGAPWNGKETRKMWMAKNGSRCLYAKYSKELHALVLKYYGPLDF